MKIHMQANKKYKSPYKYYGDLLFNKLSSGLTERGVELEPHTDQLGFNKITTKNFYEYYVQIQQMPAELPFDLVSIIRNDLKRKYPNKKVYVDLLQQCNHHIIKNNRSFKQTIEEFRISLKKTSKRMAEAQEEGYVSDYADEIMGWENRKHASFNYFKKCRREGIETPIVSYIFRIRVFRDDNPNESNRQKFLFDAINDVFLSLGFKYKIVDTYLYDLLYSISPFSHTVGKLTKTFLSNRVLSTEIISTETPVGQGTSPLGNIILGNDLFNHIPVGIDLHPASGGGTNGFIVATNGGGKSMLSKQIAEQSLAIGDYTYIIDYEGSEYKPLGDNYGATYLNLKSNVGYYYDPLRLASLTGIEEIDGDVLNNAISGVMELTSILMGKPLTEVQVSILDSVISEEFKMNDVDSKDPETWINGCNMSIKDLTYFISKLNDSTIQREKYGEDLIELHAVYKTYFEGMQSSLFKVPLSIDDIKDARLFIVQFGSDSSKELMGEDPVSVRVAQLSIIFLFQELARFRRSKNQNCLILLEELQRYIEHKGSVQWINTMYTGIRKCNGSIISMINDPSKLTSADALINNSKFFIVGRNDNIDSLAPIFKSGLLQGKEDMVDSLKNYNFAFLICKDEGYNTTHIFRSELPKQYLESPIYKTRTDKQFNLE